MNDFPPLKINDDDDDDGVSYMLFKFGMVFHRELNQIKYLKCDIG